MRHRTLLIFVVVSLTICRAQIDEATQRLSRDIFRELVEIDTTDSTGNVTLAAEAAARRLIQAGFPADDVHLLGPNDRKKNMVARLHGAGKHKPLLLLGHLDVVEAHREDWTTNPFEFVEQDGFFYGRGTQDMKDGDAILITTLMRLKREEYQPDRDIILALTADEEGGQSNGVQWLLTNHPELIDADVALNPDGGGILMDGKKAVMMEVDASEKIYTDYELTVNSPGGHSSLPVPDNAIYHLAEGLTRLEQYRFPFELNAVTRQYYERMSKVETGQRAADMNAILRNPPDDAAIARLSEDAIDNATMHTTCVATRLSAGHANNALPQRAEANVNCRILPGHSPKEVRQKLVDALGDPRISVEYTRTTADAAQKFETTSNAPTLRSDILGPLGMVTAEMWPSVPVIPTMATGASDGVYTNAAGIPTYGISGVAIDRNDIRAHGKDERLPVDSFYRGVDFYYRLLKAVTAMRDLAK